MDRKSRIARRLLWNDHCSDLRKRTEHYENDAENTEPIVFALYVLRFDILLP